MAVATTNAFSGPFTANGVTTTFPFTFTVLSDADVTVALRDADGVETAVTSGFTVTLAGDAPASGSVVFDTAPASGNDVWIYLNPAFTQETEFADGHPFIAGAVNGINDMAALRDQVLKRDVDRALVVPIGEDGLSVPAADARAGKYVKFAEDGGFGLDDPDNFAAPAAASATLSQAWAEGTLPGGAGTKSAKEHAEDAAQSAAYAGGFETPEYASQAAGNAATTEGQIFRVPIGTTPQTFNWYRRLTSGSELVSPLATTEYLASSAGAGGIGLPSGGTVADALYYVTPEMFGAVGGGVIDDTAAIQAAIDTGLPVALSKTYASGPLTQSTAFQRIFALGAAEIRKNANGVLFTSTANYLEIQGVQFIGTGYTGDNINLTGNHPRLINCSSYGTPGRALKATGAHVQIFGTCGSYTTTDATASGYDIEIGVSGTATLYHQIVGVYTSQATGGILFVDTGSHSILGGQFGKLTIQSGTSPSGVNGGMTANARILGDVNVGISNSVFTGNQFSHQTITFASGTSGHSLDETNLLGSATIVNSGNANSPIVKSVGTGSPTGIVLQYGADAGKVTIRYSTAVFEVLDGSVILANNRSIQFRDSGGNAVTGITFSSADDWTFGSSNGANFTNLASGSGGVYVGVGGTSIAQFYASGLRPQTDGTLNLGTSSQKWNQVHAKAYYVDGLKVVGAQGAAVADATGSGDVVAQLNALLARLRTHGLIAT